MSWRKGKRGLRSNTMIYTMLVFAAVGVTALIYARAAPFTASSEAESTLSGSTVDKIYHANASGGSAIRFGAPSANQAIPPRFVGGYLEWWSGVYPSEIDSDYSLLFHAFATVNSNGSLSLPLSHDRQRLVNEYRAWRAAGKPVILSIGGAGGAQAGLTNSTQVQNFITSVRPLIDEFGFAGIDWDLELGVPGGISVQGLVSASRQLKSHYGTDFAITMAPFEGIEYPYKDIARELGDDLTFVGFQFYNMAQRVNAQNAIARMEEWMNDCGLSPSQFSIGLWYGPDDWQGYTVDESLMASVYTAVKNKYPGVRGTWTWAVATTDRPRGYAFANSLSQVVY